MSQPEKRQQVLCLDFEASGLGPNCYPIEVAIVDVEQGVIQEWLINPTATWMEKGEWDVKAEAIHGLTLSFLIASGLNVKKVAQELEVAVGNALVLSDNVTHDGKWLCDLFGCMGKKPPFKLYDFNKHAWQVAVCSGRRPDIAFVKAEAEAFAQFPKIHRAGPDARRNAEIIRQVSACW